MSDFLPNPLVEVEELVLRLADPASDWRLFDCRHDLAQPAAGEAAYAAGHIPGAQFAHLDRDLSSAMTGRNGRHPMPDRAALAARLERWGVSNDSTVVVYDDHGGMFAGRLWWLMHWLGHHQVRVLNGGLAAWRAAGLGLTTDVPLVLPARFEPAAGYQVLDVAYMEAHLADFPAVPLLDARAPDRFAGQNETTDPVAGHIPGAENRFFRLNLGADGRFKSAEVLRQEFLAWLAGRDPNQIIHSCGSGVTACHNLLATAIAGLPPGRLYAGSWSEWCSDPGRPVAK